MQVHGGITEKDIVEFLKKAQGQAVINSRLELDTVVFFDEANTTDAIGLIKEVMCDRRVHGRSLPANLKFIAACNPYRRSEILCTCIWLCKFTQYMWLVKCVGADIVYICVYRIHASCRVVCENVLMSSCVGSV